MFGQRDDQDLIALSATSRRRLPDAERCSVPQSEQQGGDRQRPMNSPAAAMYESANAPVAGRRSRCAETQDDEPDFVTQPYKSRKPLRRKR
jgi:hypothetical protein